LYTNAGQYAQHIILLNVQYVRRPTYTDPRSPPPCCVAFSFLSSSRSHDIGAVIVPLRSPFACKPSRLPPLSLTLNSVCTDHLHTREPATVNTYAAVVTYRGGHHSGTWHHHGSRRDQTQFREKRLLVNYYALSSLSHSKFYQQWSMKSIFWHTKPSRR